MLPDNKSLMLGMVFCLVFAAPGNAQTPACDSLKDRHVPDLIQKLGNTSFVQRVRANKELENIGVPALEALRKASKSSDAEVRVRVLHLVGRFEEQLVTQQVLAAKEVHLKLADAGVGPAIAELVKISGYPITLQDDGKTLADKKISLDTGKTTFWQALDRLCAEAGLSEKIDAASNVALPSPDFYRGGRKRTVELYAAPPPAQTAIILVPGAGGKSESVAVNYVGAVKAHLRIRRDAKTKELCVAFCLSAEPRLLNSSLSSRPEILKAIDQDQRNLTAVLDDTAPEKLFNTPIWTEEGVRADLRRQVEARIKEDDSTVSQIRELAGKMTVRLALANDRIAGIDKILAASGRSVKGANGGTFKVNFVRKIGSENGRDQYEIQVVLDSLTLNPLGGSVALNNGNVVILVNFGRNIRIGNGGIFGAGPSGHFRGLPDLIDAKGQKFAINGVSSDDVNIFNGSFTRTATIVYEGKVDQAAPSELALYDTRTHTITVPFRFENVRIP